MCARVASEQNIALFDSFDAFAITKYILQAIYYCCWWLLLLVGVPSCLSKFVVVFGKCATLEIT